MHSPSSQAPKRRPLVQVDRVLQGPNGAQVTVVVTHEAGRPSDGLRLLDQAVAAVKARVTA